MEPGHWIVILLIVAWAAVMLGAMWQSNQKALHRHRERLALIEKGLPLPPEPAATTPWRALLGVGTTEGTEADRRMLALIRFVGILAVAVGIGIYLLLTLMSQWEAGVGFGGMMVIVGVALILTSVRALVVARRHRNGE